MEKKNIFKMDNIEEGKLIQKIFDKDNNNMGFIDGVDFFDVLFDSIFEILNDKKYTNCILLNRDIKSNGIKIYKENNNYYINFNYKIEYNNIENQVHINFNKNNDNLYNKELIEKIIPISYKYYLINYQDIDSISYIYDIIIAYMFDRINNIGNMDLETEKYYFELSPENTIYKISKK